jgi:hypothetical protein
MSVVGPLGDIAAKLGESALPPTATQMPTLLMSALPEAAVSMCSVPIQTDIARLFDDAVGTAKQHQRHIEAKRFGCFQIDDHFDFRGLPDR